MSWDWGGRGKRIAIIFLYDVSMWMISFVSEQLQWIIVKSFIFNISNKYVFENSEEVSYKKKKTLC